MQGNVWEWTGDCWRESLADTEADCRLRTRRGGSWTDIPGPVRLAARQGDPPDFRNSYTGFRLVRASP
jgi:formylglycine-generating enzyme required for sulfatase activity